MSWTASAFLSDLQDRLQAWEGLPGVDVFTSPQERVKAEGNIIFVAVVGDQDWAAIGNQTKEDAYTVESSVFVQKKGAGEKIAVEVRDAAADILKEVENTLRSIVQTPNALTAMATTIGANQITKLNLARFTLHQGANERGRWAQVDFDIQVTARI